MSVVAAIGSFLWHVLVTVWHYVADLLPHVLGLVVAAALMALLTAYSREWLKQHGETAAAKRVSSAVARYLDQVVLRSSMLLFGDPTGKTMDAAAVGSITLDQVWTPLKASARAPSADGRTFETPTTRVSSIDDALLVTDAIVQHGGRRILLLGEPGGGKSSLISYLATVSATAALSQLRGEPCILPTGIPLRIVLRDVVPSAVPVLRDAWTGVPELADPGTGRLAEQLESLMREGNVFVLMDGLDEVREDLLAGVKAVMGLVCAANRSTTVITCRTYDYGRELPNRKLNIDVTLKLLPYTFADMVVYVTNWYAAIVRAGRLGTQAAQAFKANLLDSLDRFEELRHLGETPLLLTLLTLVHTEEGELPASRALVYARAARYLLAETAQWRRQAPGATIASTEMLDLAQHVAYATHSESESQGAEWRGLGTERVREIVSRYFRLDQQPPGPNYERVSAKVASHVMRLVQSNGLLLDQGGNRYAFAHRSFQEFLAGQYFAQGSHHAAALAAAQKTHWREAFRLLAGFGAREGDSLFYLLHLIDDLAGADRPRDLPPAGTTDVTLAGEMLLEIGRDLLTANGYERVLELNRGSGGVTGMWPRISERLRVLVEMRPSTASTAERVRAADVMGNLGDPRFEDERGGCREASERFVVLPGRQVTVGSPTGVGREDERPRRTFAFAEYSISKYLVVNREYGEFVAANGYGDPRWWRTTEAQKWIAGDESFLGEVRRLWVDTVAEYHAKEIRDKEIKLDDLEHEAEIRCRPRQEPFYWKTGRFGRPNQPVVGINWWEARAYCSWLTERGRDSGWLIEGEVLRLPTEFEWERAARGVDDGRLFPWGNEWDHDRAHTREDELRLSEATPVGVYPEGSWPGGPLDLSGNVWEWLENLKLPYDLQYDTERMSDGGLGDRAIRGSSWYNTPDFARCGARFIDRPYNLYFDLGFRVVRVRARDSGVPPEAQESPGS